MTNQDLLLPFARMMQTRQPQLASDSFFEVKLSTLSKSFGAQNDNFLIWDLVFWGTTTVQTNSKDPPQKYIAQ